MDLMMTSTWTQWDDLTLLIKGAKRFYLLNQMVVIIQYAHVGPIC